jgi:enterochelin esterase-like enzyme/outer membrane protein assembly factor BamB
MDQQLPTNRFGLEVAWRRDLGSGYSNIWIEADKGITMFTAEDVDVVTAFEIGNGKEIWRYELAEKYRGHDGSDDGPIGTPIVSDGVVFALGPGGQLVALDLADGAEKWRRQLDAENSTTPFYGYTASPVVIGDAVVVTTGGEEHAITAFDRQTGAPKWSQGDDSVSYQTPMVVDLGDRQLLIAVTNHFLYGLDPQAGEILWELQHTEGGDGEESAHPTPVDGERFLVNYQNGSRLYRAVDGGIEEVWQSRAFGNAYALPVLVDDHFYGFTGSILTCASLETGEIVWRSRALGGLGLAKIGDHLAVASLDGDLVLFDASPEGFQELTRISVLESGNYAIPSFADGIFVVRNLEQIAAVRADTDIAPQVAEVDHSDRIKGDFGKWVVSVEALPLPERQKAVDQRTAAAGTSPLFEEAGLAHLLWRGEAEDVGVQGDLIDNGQEIGMFRVEGTDLFYRSFELDSKAQYAYNFTVDFGDPIVDPANSYSVDSGFVVASELRMPEWPASPHLESPGEEAPRGTLDSFLFRSEVLENTREVQVWRPADYGRDPEKRYPLLVVNHGNNLLRGGLMENSLNNLVGSTVEPLIAVFVPRASGPEYGGPAAENYNRFLVEELLPHLDHHYLTDPTRRAIMGPGSAGVAAILAAVSHPEVFQRAASQSFYPIEPSKDTLPKMIAGAEAKPEFIYVVWSRRDYVLGNGARAEDASRAVVAQLSEAGVTVVEQVSDYSPGWGGWRGQHDEILAALFPYSAPDAE